MPFLLFLLLNGLLVSCPVQNPKPSPVLFADTSHPVSQQLLLADPTIFYDNGMYYLYGTRVTNDGIEVYTSANLKNWQKEKTLALSKKDVFGESKFWAPQIFKYKNKYYIAYAADEHIAIAESDSPLGPFKQKTKQPLIKNVKTIDPFILIKGRHKYLYYVKLREGNRIFAAELKDDFSGIKSGTEHSCVNATNHPQAWENAENKPWTVTEGPTVLKHDGKYYLFYSCNDFRSIYYAVGYAVSEHPFGPWRKFEGNPILNKDLIGENGPGHGDFFIDRDGQYEYVFHTHFSKEQVSPRKTAIIQGKFVDDNGTSKMIFDKSSFHYLKIKGE